MTNRYYWVIFELWQRMTPTERAELEDWAKAGGMEVAIDLRDDYQKEPKTEDNDDV